MCLVLITMMSRMSVLILVLGVAALVTADDEKYPSKYDNINIDTIVSNERLLLNYFKCLSEEKDSHCTDDAKFIKRVLSEGLKSNCAKCSDVQKDKAVKMVSFVYKNHRELWDTIAAKYDPEGVFISKNPEVTA